ncbi:MAG TPA: CapA family protein [Galbitalea sp.]
MSTRLSDGRWLLWEDPAADILTQVAVGGDYLPPPTTLPDEPVERAKALGPLVEDIDACFLNLESPILPAGGVPAPKAGLGVNLSSPESALAYFEPLKVAVVGLANNHVYDFGVDGERATRSAVGRVGAVALGSAIKKGSPPSVHVWQGPAGVKVGFWACANNTLTQASRRREGVEPATTTRGSSALAALRMGGATTFVALVHAGMEHTNYPDPADVSLLHELAELGFDVVAAAHSHRLSGWTTVLGDGTPRFCFHGLGSVSSSVIYSGHERFGALVVVGIGRSGRPARLELRPIALDKDGWGQSPDPELERAVFASCDRISREIESGSYANLFYRDLSDELIRVQLADLVAAWRAEGPLGIARKLRRTRLKHLQRLLFRLSPSRRTATEHPREP